MNFEGQHVLRAKDLSKEGIERILEVSKTMQPIADKQETSDLMAGEVLATLFFEPSTRTRFSFETAMLRLGGKVISNYNMKETSSVKKRETLYDTGKMVSTFADVIAMRHPGAETVAELAKGSSVPVLNGGDGPADHPTQGLLDVYTIWKQFGTLDGLTIGMIGDLKYGRVPHAEVELLKHFDVKFVFVAPEALKMPSELLETCRGMGREVVETESFEDVIGEMDVIACTRIQEERFESTVEYEKYAGIYVLDKNLMGKAKEDAIVMHPLPRVDEIAIGVDNDPRAKYFEQVANGVAVRMALIALVMGKA